MDRIDLRFRVNKCYHIEPIRLRLLTTVNVSVRYCLSGGGRESSRLHIPFISSPFYFIFNLTDSPLLWRGDILVTYEGYPHFGDIIYNYLLTFRPIQFN